MAKKATDAYQQFIKDWQQRSAWAGQQNVPAPAFNTVFNMDKQRLTSGGQPMSNYEATRALIAATTLHHNVEQPAPSTSSNPGTVAGNALHDVKTFFSGLGGLIAHPMGTLVDPMVRGAEQLPRDLAQAGQDLFEGKIRSTLSDLAHNNLLDMFVPGVSDLGIVAKNGWGGLMQHPFFAVLDVAPVGKVVGYAGQGLGIVEREGADVAAKMGRMPRFIATEKYAGTQLGDIMTTLRQHGTYHLIGKGIAKIPTSLEKSAYDIKKTTNEEGNTTQAIEMRRQNLGDKFHNIAVHFHLDEATKPYIRGLTTETLTAQKQSIDLMKRMTRMVDQSGEVDRAELGVYLMSNGKPEYMPAYMRDDPVLQAGAQGFLKAQQMVLDSLDPEMQGQLNLDLTERTPETRRKLEQAGRNYMAPIDMGQMGMQLYDDTRRGEYIKLSGAEGTAQKALNDHMTSLDTLSKGKSRAYTLLTALQDSLDHGKLTPEQHAASYIKTQAVIQKLEGKLKSLNGKTAKLEADIEKAHAARQDWVIANPPNNFNPIMHRALVMYALSERLLHEENIPVELQRKIKKLLPKPNEKITPKQVEGLLRFGANLHNRKNFYGGNDVVYNWYRKYTHDYSTADAARQAFGDNPKAIDQMLKDMAHTWTVLATVHDLAPVYMPERTLDQVRKAMHPVLHPTKEARETTFITNRGPGDISNYINDPVVALHSAAVDLMLYNRKVAFHKTVIEPGTLSTRVLEDEWQIRKNARTGPHNDLLGEHQTFQLWRDENYVRYNPETFGIHRAERDKFFSPDELWLPRDIYEGIQQLVKYEEKMPGSKVLMKGNSMFKTTLLTLSPRYLVHMTVGTMFMTSVKYDPLYLLKLGRSIHLLKEGKLLDKDPDLNATRFKQLLLTHGNIGQVGMRIPHELSMHTPFDDPGVPIWQVLAGRTQFRLSVQERLARRGIDPVSAKPVEWAMAGLHAWFDGVTFLNNAQRVALLLHHIEKLRKKGISDDVAEQEAVRLCSKVFGDLNAMAPIERAVARNAIPFYGWTRTIVSYAFTLPADNPFRVMILSNLSEIEQNDRNSSLPDVFQYLFFLGHPDANGNVKAVDVRGIDPMRDVGNYFTVGGFFSMFTPLITGTLESATGISPFSGTPELYPQLQYNSFYGTLQTKVAPAQAFQQALESSAPQLQALDFALGFSKQMKQYRASDSKGFAYTLASYLNFPYIPQHINVRQEAARTNNDLYLQMEQLVTSALQTGDFSKLLGFDQVPVRGWDVSPAGLQKVAEILAKKYGVPASEVVNSIIPAAKFGQGVNTQDPNLNQQPFAGVGS